MEAACSICNRDLQNLPITELLCHHVCHTFCFLNTIQTANTNNQLHFLACVSCETPVFGQQEEPDFTQEAVETEAETETETEAETHEYMSEHSRVENLYTANAEFRTDIKKYMTALRGSAKPRQVFLKIVAAKKAELQPRYEQIKALYEGLYQTKKNELMSCDEYKAHRKADARAMRYWNLLRNKYNVRGYSLTALRNKRGCKSIRRPRYSFRYTPQYAIRKAIHLRLPWY